MLAIALGLTIHLYKKDRIRQTDPEATRYEQRRVNAGWWDQESSPPGTVIEKREILAREARVSQGRSFEGGIEREARGEQEAREGGARPPMYLMPASAYDTSLAFRVQLGRNRKYSLQQRTRRRHTSPRQFGA